MNFDLFDLFGVAFVSVMIGIAIGLWIQSGDPPTETSPKKEWWETGEPPPEWGGE